MKYVSGYTDTSLSDALRNMADYLEKDHTDMKIHGAYLADMTKFLKRLTTETIRKRALEDLDIEIPETKSKASAIESYLDAFVKKTEESIL